MSVRIISADVLAGLAQIDDESVHCVVTSPPYWGLRDYGVAGQIGMEPTPEAFVGRMVEVFREVRRVLRKDGTCWVNLGDSYAGSWGAQSRGDEYPGGLEGTSQLQARSIKAHPLGTKNTGSLKRTPGLKSKDLIGIPWRVAFALQADGWWLRSDIVWSKPNPMPESVTDRPTKSHEYLFLLTKAERYWYDAEAIKEPYSNGIENATPWKANGGVRNVGGRTDGLARGTAPDWRAGDGGRNKRSVWTIATAPFPEAHFATFPPELPEICIKAGCPVGGTVLDPFAGAGTTLLVADRLQRNGIGIELNPEYAAMAERRVVKDAPLFAELET